MINRKSNTQLNNHGTFLSTEDMLSFEPLVKGINLSCNAFTSSLLLGQDASRKQGRGGRYEEIRQYVAGDDTRHIDWNVTARLRKPHVRTYCEDREMPLFLILDQRSDMFFGSSLMMKSYAAGSVAAHLIWAAKQNHQRTGLVVFNDLQTDTVPLRQGIQHTIELFNTIGHFNQLLSSKSCVAPNVGMLEQSLESFAQICKVRAHVVIISDFSGFCETTCQLMARLNSRHAVTAIQIHDNLIFDPPRYGDLTATLGDLVARVNLGKRKTCKAIFDTLTNRVRTVQQQLLSTGISTVTVHTGQPITDQLHEIAQNSGDTNGL